MEVVAFVASVKFEACWYPVFCLYSPTRLLFLHPEPNHLWRPGLQEVPSQHGLRQVPAAPDGCADFLLPSERLPVRQGKESPEQWAGTQWKLR